MLCEFKVQYNNYQLDSQNVFNIFLKIHLLVLSLRMVRHVSLLIGIDLVSKLISMTSSCSDSYTFSKTKEMIT